MTILPTKSNPYHIVILFALPTFILFFILSIGILSEGSQQFSELAQAFLHGHLYFLKPIGGLGQDPVLYHGRVYWDEGAFPAILLMPFVALFSIFHIFFYQGYIKWLLSLGVLFFIYRLARVLKYNYQDSVILMLGFALGSVFIGVDSVSSGWLFAQVVSTFLLFWGLYEFYNTRRWWLLGLICGLTFLTRATATPIIIFFFLELWQSKALSSDKLKLLAQLVVPVVVAVGLQALYNFLRFHNPFNGGYEYQLIDSAAAGSRALGVFSLAHIPANFYACFLSAPITVLSNAQSWSMHFPFIENNNEGLSMFLVSPYLLYLFTQKWSSYDRTARNLLVATVVSCFWVFCFYGIGREQFGYRYSLDFLPELFMVFMIIYRKGHKQISRGMKFLLLGSGVTNFYLVLSYIF